MIDRERARAAGYTDAEIDAYEAQQKQQAQGPVAPDGVEPPPPPPPDPNQGKASEASMGELATTTVMAAAPYALPAIGVGAAGYGAYKVGGWGRDLARSARDVAGAMRERTAVEAAREERMANRPGFGGQPRPGSTMGPVAPQGAPAPAATPAPVAQPAPAPAQASQPGVAQRVAQMAYDKLTNVAQRAAPYARAGMGALAALTPGNIGQDYPFPMSGPMRGQEINPQTGRPWTREELSAYYATQR